VPALALVPCKRAGTQRLHATPVVLGSGGAPSATGGFAPAKCDGVCDDCQTVFGRRVEYVELSPSQLGVASVVTEHQFVIHKCGAVTYAATLAFDSALPAAGPIIHGSDDAPEEPETASDLVETDRSAA